MNQLLAQSLRYQIILETNNWNLINLFSGISVVYRSKVNSAVNAISNCKKLLWETFKGKQYFER